MRVHRQRKKLEVTVFRHPLFGNMGTNFLLEKSNLVHLRHRKSVGLFLVHGGYDFYVVNDIGWGICCVRNSCHSDVIWSKTLSILMLRFFVRSMSSAKFDEFWLVEVMRMASCSLMVGDEISSYDEVSLRGGMMIQE